MKWKELIKSEEFKWFNIFFRDILLVFIMIYVNYYSYFRSWWAAFITGMLTVWISWQFTDYLKYRRLYGK